MYPNKQILKGLNIGLQAFINLYLQHGLTRKELGEFTAMTKESVSRILKEFKDESLISLEGSHIELHDKEHLQRIVDNS